ncbi:hypothetical protein ACFX13_030892 [Malus domestica]
MSKTFWPSGTVPPPNVDEMGKSKCLTQMNLQIVGPGVDVGVLGKDSNSSGSTYFFHRDLSSLIRKTCILRILPGNKK